jgi:sugar O-acyltransferase (sialic acid O-acetyltransferase NeuD family)
MKRIVVGYSGHSYVVIESAISCNYIFNSYMELVIKDFNPFNLNYIGSENDSEIIENLEKNSEFFVCLGNNNIRKQVTDILINKGLSLIKIFDKSAQISNNSEIHDGVYIGKNVIVNPFSKILQGSIINTSAIIEHECTVGSFSHIAPGSVLCGGVKIGNNSFVGANSVVKEGVVIGNNVIIGAGTTIYENIPDNIKVVGTKNRFL